VTRQARWVVVAFGLLAGFELMLGLVFGFSTANTFLTALATVVAVAGSLTQFFPISGQKSSTVPGVPPPGTAARQAGERHGRQPWLILGAGLFLIALLGGALALRAGKQPECVSGFSDEFGRGPDTRWIWVSPQSTATLIPSTLGTVQMTAPRDSDLLPNNPTAPRLLQSIGGDFTLETRLLFSPSNGYQGAGLLIWQDRDNFARLELGYGGFRGIEFSRSTHGAYSHIVDAWTYGGKSIPTRSDNVLLRLQRTDNHLKAWWRDSTDGAAWQYVGETVIDLDREVQVGIALVNVSSHPNVAARFDYLHLSCP